MSVQIVIAFDADFRANKRVSHDKMTQRWKSERTKTKSKLAYVLAALFPVFPLIYILGLVHVLDRDGVVVANMVAGLIIKLSFCGVLSLESVVLQLSEERKANESRRQLLRYVFHEIRVPLNTLTMGIAVLKDGEYTKLGDAGRDVVDMMDGAAGFMSDTLSDVLSMTKLEDRDMHIVYRPFSMATLVRNATLALRSQVEAKYIRILVEGMQQCVDQDGEEIYFEGDNMRLEHVLMNFLSNAVKFSEEGSEIRIKVGVVENNKPSAYLGRMKARKSLSVKNDQTKGNPQGNSPANNNQVDAYNNNNNNNNNGTTTNNNVATNNNVTINNNTNNNTNNNNKNNNNNNNNNNNTNTNSGMKKNGLMGAMGGGIRQASQVQKISDRDTYRQVSCYVVDKGIGISEEDQEKLWIPFALIRPGDAQEGRGSGLALPLAKEILTLHGGSVSLTSEVGVGSTFGFTLPLKV